MGLFDSLSRSVKGYHATGLGNAQQIAKDGWIVYHNIVNGQVYGRGIYFWDRLEDAHTLGELWWGKGKYEILSEYLPYKSKEFTTFDKNLWGGHDPDTIALSHLAKGIKLAKIPNPYMEISTMPTAKGDAFVWFVNINENDIVIS